MKLPERLQQKIAPNAEMMGEVGAAIRAFEPWLRDNNLTFFPYYTDHSQNHVEQVLTTATELIRAEAWDAFSARDACLLVLAVLLHDCAMQLTAPSFMALVAEAKPPGKLRGFDETPWPVLWQDYLFSAKRFDARTLAGIIGEDAEFRVPPTDPAQLTETDRLLIGEFLRRHHARLAHEIAVFGLPTRDGRMRLLGESSGASKLSNSRLALYDMAGLIARSHGMPLRKLLSHRDREDLTVDGRGHPIFLMSLLRVADYLQLEATRAPEDLLRIKDIRIPISRREWRTHAAVGEIHYHHPDPDAVYVKAEPEDVAGYLRLKEWLAGIQEELDLSWAVLGEIYAPVRLSTLGLRIRRVRSNLDDEVKFAERVDYVPKRIELDLARAEALKLLVKPLYGNRPEVGIRELLQNSLDAVRELWDLQEKRPELKEIEQLEQEADVVIWLDEPDESGMAHLTVSDRGVGMTEQVISDYFLKVGASYRHSDAWARQHERRDDEETAEAGAKSRVLRSGRFGIGVLAAFLLGDEIEVSTRHATSSRGIRFSTTLESEFVELRYDADLPVGTTIRVPVPPDVYEGLTRPYRLDEWDWYCLEKPSVVRLLGGNRTSLPQRIKVPDARQGLQKGWYRVHHSNVPAVHCSHQYGHNTICNGIRLGSSALGIYPFGGPLGASLPLVSIFDPDGNLELDLTRSRVEPKSGLGEAVKQARYRFLLAYLLQNVPGDASHLDRPEPLHVEMPRFSGSVRLWPWFLTNNGLSICTQWNIQRADVQSALVVISGTKGAVFHIARNPHNVLFKLVAERPYYTPSLGGLAGSCLRELQYAGNQGEFASLRGAGTRVITTAKIAAATLEQNRAQRVLREWAAEVKEERWSKRWVALTQGNPPPSRISVEQLEAAARQPEAIPILSEWYFEPKPATSDIHDTLSWEWEQIIREPVIPFDLEERRRKLAHAYEALAEYFNAV